MGARRSMGKQYDGVCARDRQPIPRPIDVDAAPRDARARADADAMTDTKRAVDADDARDETRAKKPKAATTKSDAARRIQPGTRALSDAAKLLPDAAPPHLRDDFTIQQLQRLAEAFAANEVAGYQRQ